MIDDAADYDGLRALIPTVDGFGVPSDILGPHPEEFFQMLGRIVALSAALERNVRLVCDRLASATEGAFSADSFGQAVKTGRKNLARFLEDSDRALAADFLARSESAILKRHAYAHSLWPAQAGGEMYGWKLSRKATSAGVDEISQTLDDMRADLAALVALCEVPYWHRLLGAVSSEHHLQPQADIG